MERKGQSVCGQSRAAQDLTEDPRWPGPVPGRTHDGGAVVTFPNAISTWLLPVRLAASTIVVPAWISLGISSMVGAGFSAMPRYVSGILVRQLDLIGTITARTPRAFSRALAPRAPLSS